MKTFILVFALLASASLIFAQHRGFGNRDFGGRVIVRQGLIGPGYGYYDPFWFGYSYGYYPSRPIAPNPCQKEKLKGEDGRKHEVLACRQADGSIKVYNANGEVR